jgi:hypothetical protein
MLVMVHGAGIDRCGESVQRWNWRRRWLLTKLR